MATTGYLVLWVPLSPAYDSDLKAALARIRTDAGRFAPWSCMVLDSVKRQAVAAKTVFPEDEDEDEDATTVDSYSMLVWGAQSHGFVCDEDMCEILPELHRVLVEGRIIRDSEYVRAVVSDENDTKSGWEYVEGVVYFYGGGLPGSTECTMQRRVGGKTQPWPFAF